MKRIESEEFVDLLTHLMTDNTDLSFNDVWDYYFTEYHKKYQIGFMTRDQLKDWLFQEVKDQRVLNHARSSKEKEDE